MNRRTIEKSIFEKALMAMGIKNELENHPEKLTLAIDSRTLEPNDIFFAIKGEFADGHDYMLEAYNKGAALIIAERLPKELAHLPVILVKDSLKFFSLLAHEHLKALDVIKIAITGSNGKTTTKEMVKSCLIKIFGQDQVYASDGNKNNHFGIPLSALEVSFTHKMAIFEMGMNHAQEISSHCEIIEPHFGIITNVSFAHEGNFADGIDGVAKAKTELFDFLKKSGGVSIVNLDDERIKTIASNLQLKSFTFGHDAKADIRILEHQAYSTNNQAQEVRLSVLGEEFSCLIPLAGSHHAQNTAAALALILALGQDVKLASLGLLSMKQTSGRMNIKHSPDGWLLLNDGYNANPSSMRAGILASLELPATRRIAVIGAMGELGNKSAAHHHELGKLLAEHFDQLFLCGQDAQHAVMGAKEAGLLENKIFYAKTSVELIEPIKEILKEGDLIFIKGSLSANMKAVTDGLLYSG